jgi:hypothetical protein
MTSVTNRPADASASTHREPAAAGATTITKEITE